MNQLSTQKGFMAISVVILISAAVLIIATTVALVGVGEAQSSLSINKGESNLSLVEGCAEDYLLKIRSNPTYTASAITRPEGTCSIVINSGNPNWDVIISSTDLNFKRKVQLKFTRGLNTITLTSWKEI